jgi:Zn-dependent M28 family amino/carboxypeptidase
MQVMRRVLRAACGVLLATWIVAAVAQDAPKSSLFDSAQLLTDLRVLASDEMQGRRVGTPGGEKARNYIVERFKASGVRPFGASYESPFTFTTARGNTTSQRGVNVVGHIDGKRSPRHYIVVSAHYDHLGVRNGVVFNGADDNASGTAALFSIAKYFATHQPENSLIFVAFDAEEVGLFGSQAFVKQPPVDSGLLSLNINADMIGRDPDDKLFAVGTARQPFLKPYIVAVAKNAPVKLLIGHEDPNQPEDWTADSDHYSFLRANIPALYLGVEDFDQHHAATDDYETMTFSFYVRVVETIIQVIREFDSNLDPVINAKRGR